MDSTYREPTAGAAPTSYSVLALPSKAVMVKKGYDPTQLTLNGLEAHPLSKWTSHSLPRGATYKDAVTAINKENAAPWGIVKVRLNFDDGSHEEFVRTNPGDPGSLKNDHTYNPNDVFRTETLGKTTTARAKLQPRLAPLVDERGHYTGSKKLPRSFAPENLYKDAPPPVHSQAGYDFSPVSHASFLLRPADEPEGARRLRSNFMHESCDYRPRAHLRQQPRESRHCHCAEVYQAGDYTLDMAHLVDETDGRNRRSVKQFTATGSLKPQNTVVGQRHYREPRFGQTGMGASRSEKRRLLNEQSQKQQQQQQQQGEEEGHYYPHQGDGGEEYEAGEAHAAAVPHQTFQ